MARWRLAAARLAEEQDRGAGFDEAEPGEVGDELGVDGGLEVEVELLDGAPGREVGEAQPGVQASLAGGGGFLGDERGEELEAVVARSRSPSARPANTSAARCSLR